MKKNETIFYYFAQVCSTFGITMLLLILFCLLFGEGAKDISTMFCLGNKGLSVATMMEFFLVSVIGVVLRIIFFKDILIKQMSILKRTTFMVVSLTIVMAICIAVFGWFPINNIIGWLLFILSFSICIIVSVLITGYCEKKENQKLEEALDKLKQEL